MTTRFFRAPTATLDAIRAEVLAALEQPNGRGAEPWPVGGDFNDGTYGYTALGEHHTTGEFAPLLNEFIDTPGVEEIDDATYLAAQPSAEP